MKKLSLIFTLFFCITLFNCESEPVTGSEDVTILPSVTITIDTTYVFGNDFRAEGKATNNGNETVTPVWFVEGAFFTDGQSSIKMGGANDWFNFSLEPGQSAEWILRFKDGQYPASEYPDFTVGSLRAYKDGVESEED